MRGIGAFCVAILATVVAAGCGRGDSVVPVVPGDQPSIQNSVEAATNDNRQVWGLWEINISADRQTTEIVPARIEQMHLNVVRMLEVSPCKDCLTVGNLKVVEPNVLEADLTLTHPFPGVLKYTGFDVRGIFISEANYTFPVSGKQIASGTGVPVLLNADGHTQVFNPTEYPPTIPAVLGYIPGKYATGGDLTATLNPFLAYRRDAPRRMFEAGGSETRTAKIYAPSGPIHFGYAVDVCWQLVPHEIVDPLVDFPPDANCLEAYKISVDFPYDLNSSWMSQNPVNVEVFDHQGLATILSVTIEAPDLFAGEISVSYSTQTGDDSWLFSGMVPNESGVTEGNYPFLVKVTDTDPDQHLGPIQGWSAGMTRVKQGWVRTWGGTGGDEGSATAIDGSGNIYVTGYFSDIVDFDPGPNVDNHVSNGICDGFLAKFDPSGNFIWARTWGGTGAGFASGAAVAVDGSGNVVVTGIFGGTVDFNPEPDVDSHVSNGGYDAFLTKFDSSGNFAWAWTWGGSEYDDYGYGAACDGSGNVYVTGQFFGTVDLDPGPDVDNHDSNVGYDAYLTKFDSSGNFAWARTWGGTEDNDYGFGAISDGSENVYVTGAFSGTADFDLGPDVDNHVSNGGYDAFLTKFDSSGNSIWARTWGGTEYSDFGQAATVDGSENVYITGGFEGAVDFDPGPDVDSHVSNGVGDPFVTKFDSGGSFFWARTWGGTDIDDGHGVAADGSGNVFVIGEFRGTVDFNPEPDVDEHASNGLNDTFLAKFDSSGNFSWAWTWGGIMEDVGAGVVADASGNAYVAGTFHNETDFDPGPGIDDHIPNGFWDCFLSKFPPDGSW